MNYFIHAIIQGFAIVVRERSMPLFTLDDMFAVIKLLTPGDLLSHAREEILKEQMKLEKTSESGLVFKSSDFAPLLRRYGIDPYAFSGLTSAITTFVEYNCAEVLELSGNAAIDMMCTSVAERHVRIGITNDEELNEFAARLRTLNK
eukprot:gnl/Chilomastix_cuspidata/4594.p2 GENE.gnl/Chilomastix_cuspidata/4594~~gnl/Chilomastix_cuspidata/4594.p2  ORF type:complete len:147 (+),score=54.17 gnl/Chilomastix_cuspidata/4594:196-636(+)